MSVVSDEIKNVRPRIVLDKICYMIAWDIMSMKQKENYVLVNIAWVSVQYIIIIIIIVSLLI